MTFELGHLYDFRGCLLQYIFRDDKGFFFDLFSSDTRLLSNKWNTIGIEFGRKYVFSFEENSPELSFFKCADGQELLYVDAVFKSRKYLSLIASQPNVDETWDVIPVRIGRRRMGIS